MRCWRWRARCSLTAAPAALSIHVSSCRSAERRWLRPSWRCVRALERRPVAQRRFRRCSSRRRSPARRFQIERRCKRRSTSRMPASRCVSRALSLGTMRASAKRRSSGIRSPAVEPTRRRERCAWTARCGAPPGRGTKRTVRSRSIPAAPTSCTSRQSGRCRRPPTPSHTAKDDMDRAPRPRRRRWAPRPRRRRWAPRPRRRRRCAARATQRECRWDLRRTRWTASRREISSAASAP